MGTDPNASGVRAGRFSARTLIVLFIAAIVLFIVAEVLYALVLSASSGSSGSGGTAETAGGNAAETLAVSDTQAASGTQAVFSIDALPAVDYSANIVPLYQNALGLYEGCELVSLTMVLNGVGLELGAWDVVNNYVDYLSDQTASFDEDRFADSFGSRQDRFGDGGEGGEGGPQGADGEGGGAASGGNAGDSPEASGSGADAASAFGGNAGGAEGSAPTAGAGEPADSSSAADSASSKHWSITQYYMGDPAYSGMGYPPAIAKAANKALEALGSTCKAHDATGLSSADAFALAAKGYPVITWATLYFGDPVFSSWVPEGEEDWPWYSNFHCVVLSGYDEQTDTVEVCDPLQGLIQMPAEEFARIYEACGNMAVTVY